MIEILGNTYELLGNHKDGWNPEAFTERYSEVLNKYDYIVGDWGYNQLRLRGFYDTKRNRIPENMRIDTVEDYIMEYCNFGCAHFILKKTKETSPSL